MKSKDSDDLWRLLIKEAFEHCNSEFNERVTECIIRHAEEEKDDRYKCKTVHVCKYKAFVNIFVV